MRCTRRCRLRKSCPPVISVSASQGVPMEGIERAEHRHVNGHWMQKIEAPFPSGSSSSVGTTICMSRPLYLTMAASPETQPPGTWTDRTPGPSSGRSLSTVAKKGGGSSRPGALSQRQQRQHAGPSRPRAGRVEGGISSAGPTCVSASQPAARSRSASSRLPFFLGAEGVE